MLFDLYIPNISQSERQQRQQQQKRKNKNSQPTKISQLKKYKRNWNQETVEWKKANKLNTFKRLNL